MPTVAIVPVKSFELGNLRLSETLAAEQRIMLGRNFAQHIVHVVEESGMLPLIVAGDAAVTEWALRSGVPSLEDPGTGLDDAAGEGTKWAAHSSSPWLVLHSDLPLLTTADLELLEGGMRDSGWVIAPSADGGTSALGGEGSFSFSYGPGSFTRHLARAPGSRIVTRLGLLHDVDSPGDLASVMAHPRGQWLRDP